MDHVLVVQLPRQTHARYARYARHARYARCARYASYDRHARHARLGGRASNLFSLALSLRLVGELRSDSRAGSAGYSHLGQQRHAPSVPRPARRRACLTPTHVRTAYRARRSRLPGGSCTESLRRAFRSRAGRRRPGPTEEGIGDGKLAPSRRVKSPALKSRPQVTRPQVTCQVTRAAGVTEAHLVQVL